MIRPAQPEKREQPAGEPVQPVFPRNGQKKLIVTFGPQIFA